MKSQDAQFSVGCAQKRHYYKRNIKKNLVKHKELRRFSLFQVLTPYVLLLLLENRSDICS